MGGEEGGAYGGQEHGLDQNQPPPIKTERVVTPEAEADYQYPLSPRAATPNPFSRKNTSMDLDDYFEGPRDIAKHSKWPLFLQMHGSITPKMVVPILAVAAWATFVTLIHTHVHKVDVANILLTITGFVVSMGLSLRSSTAYERYAEGRRYWGTLTLSCQQLGRVFWVHAKTRQGHEKEDILGKLTAMNLLVAFAVSLKHKLRFEPYSDYEDLTTLIDHLETFAKTATDGQVFKATPPNIFKRVGQNLGVSFAASNPRKALKKATSPVGNLPLEIMCYLSAYADDIVAKGQMPVPMTQTLMYNGLVSLNDVMVGTERVLNTPLPIAYTIAFSQITWLYIAVLPFQLVGSLSYITIPASVAAAYIILGILFIGREIEDPFGSDVNDLPLDHYCAKVMEDMEIISSRPPANPTDFITSSRNKVMFPYSDSSYVAWANRPESALKSALKNRPFASFDRTTPTGNGTKKTTAETSISSV